MSTYLVTGCAGFIGSQLVERLLARGDDVIGIDIFTDYYERYLKERNLAVASANPAFVLHEVDLVDADLRAIVSTTDGVFHLAAQAGVRGSWGATFSTYVHDNLLATQRILEAAVAGGVRVVWASSSSVYGNAEAYPVTECTPPHPVSPYGVTKLSCEHLARAYRGAGGLDDVALRYFTVYGPRQRPDMAFCRIAKALGDGSTFRIFGDGRQSRDVTYVGDAVEATMAAMARAPAGAVYNIGGGSETSLLEVIALAEALTGRSLQLQFSDVAVGDVRRTAADIRRAGSELSWRPQVTLREGLLAQLADAGVPAGADDPTNAAGPMQAPAPQS